MPQIVFGNTAIREESTLKLLGVSFDRTLSYLHHIRSIAIRANQRLGLLRKASRILDTRGRLVVYKSIVRPVMEYASLVWAGSSNAHLQQLHNVQKRALTVIGPSMLPSLHVRRYMYGLSYLYKLQCMQGPPLLTDMVPPPPAFIPSVTPRTRCQHQALAGHSHQLALSLPASSPDFIRRAFPHFVLN